jgi:phosphate transport system substrate-binding protein
VSNGKRVSICVALAGVLALVLAFALAGCGGVKTASDATTQTPAAPSTVVPNDTATSAGTATTAVAALAGSLTGAGATFPGPLYLEWIGEFQKQNSGVTINYQPVGSGGGITQFTKMTVDFGASDAPMKDAEIAAAEAANAGAKVLHIPTVFGAIVAAYNVSGVSGLKLDSDTLAGIFLGTIAKWNDPKLVALNPDAKLPDLAIQVVHRSDSSGTTNGFTSYLAAVSPEWATKVGKGKDVKWPVGIGGQGNDGVAAVVKQQEGSIGYVELTYALESKMTMADLKNKSGAFITPSLESTSAAVQGATVPDDLRFSVMDSAGPTAYPIVTATWILAYSKMADVNKAALLKAYLTWALTSGDAIAKDLGYAPLPTGLKDRALAKVQSIKAS